MKLDPAVVSLLRLDAAQTSVSSHGGGGCSSARTSKITTSTDGTRARTFFMKTDDGAAAKVMFAGEHASLNAIHSAVPTLCPQSYGHGALSDGNKHFLVTDFLHISGQRGAAPPGTSMTLAQKLAQLHTTVAPTPPGCDTPQFGFPVPTCCGNTAQDNTFTPSWADFYAERRLRFILNQSHKSGGRDPILSDLVERTCDEVVPRLLRDGHLGGVEGIKPVVVHGDLWSGNAGRGRLFGMEQPEDVVFDSSACYGHSEFELGIMRMFGGFGGSFMEEYHALVPKTEPAEEYEDRVDLYELYHHLNHHAMFGGGYRRGAASIMERLLAKYGNKAARHGEL